MAQYWKPEPDSKLIDFYRYIPGPYFLNDFDSSTLRFIKRNSVFDPLRQTEFENKVKAWLGTYIFIHHSNDVVLMCVAPGHKAYDTSSFMYRLVMDLITENRILNIEDGRGLLMRCKTIPKQAYAGGNRSEQTHRESILLNVFPTANLHELNRGKVVIILDDVWTTGCTLRVCEEKVRETGPKDVKLLAIGRAVLM